MRWSRARRSPSTTPTYDNGVKVVPAYLCEVDNIDASNYMKLFESGFYDKADDTWAGIVE